MTIRARSGPVNYRSLAILAAVLIPDPAILCTDGDRARDRPVVTTITEAARAATTTSLPNCDDASKCTTRQLADAAGVTFGTAIDASHLDETDYRTTLVTTFNSVTPENEMKWPRFLIRDSAGQFTRSFDDVFGGSGITAIRIPPRAPRANACAERWVRTLRHELLDRTIIRNERQLRALLVEYIEHYNQHRPHRGIDQRAPNDTVDVVPIGPGHPIQRRSRCGGLINEGPASARKRSIHCPARLRRNGNYAPPTDSRHLQGRS